MSKRSSAVLAGSALALAVSMGLLPGTAPEAGASGVSCDNDSTKAIHDPQSRLCIRVVGTGLHVDSVQAKANDQACGRTVSYQLRFSNGPWSITTPERPLQLSCTAWYQLVSDPTPVNKDFPDGSSLCLSILWKGGSWTPPVCAKIKAKGVIGGS